MATLAVVISFTQTINPFSANGNIVKESEREREREREIQHLSIHRYVTISIHIDASRFYSCQLNLQ